MESTIINISVRRFLLLILIILLVPLISSCAGAGAGAGADSILVSDISKEIMCPCGECTEVLNVCDCPRADELTALIEKKLSQGQSAEQIVLYFLNQYGEQILVQ